MYNVYIMGKSYKSVAVGKRTYRQEHRVVMENHLGRKLEKTEVVHHINGNRKDNRLENLQLLKNQKEHMALHKAQDPNFKQKDYSSIVSVHHMAKAKMLPWLKSTDRRTYLKTVEREMQAKNILKPVVMGVGNAKRYYINVANINKLNKAVEKGYTF